MANEIIVLPSVAGHGKIDENLVDRNNSHGMQQPIELPHIVAIIIVSSGGNNDNYRRVYRTGNLHATLSCCAAKDSSNK